MILTCLTRAIVFLYAYREAIKGTYSISPVSCDSVGSIPAVTRLNIKVGFPNSSGSFYSWGLVLSAITRHPTTVILYYQVNNPLLLLLGKT